MWRSLDARADGLLYGCVLAIVRSAWPDRRMPTLATTLAAIGLAAIAVRPVPSLELYLSNALSAVFVFGIVTDAVPRLNRALSVPWLTYLGRISYGLYLYHFPIAAAFYVAGAGPWSNLVLTTAVSVPLATASWHLVEAPLLHRRAARSTARSPVRTGRAPASSSALAALGKEVADLQADGGNGIRPAIL